YVREDPGAARGEVEVIWIRERQIASRLRRATQRHELILILNAGERTQERGLDPAENRGIRGDAEPEYGDGDDCERRTTDDHPPGKAKVVRDHVRAPVADAEDDRVR